MFKSQQIKVNGIKKMVLDFNNERVVTISKIQSVVITFIITTVK